MLLSPTATEGQQGHLEEVEGVQVSHKAVEILEGQVQQRTEHCARVPWADKREEAVVEIDEPQPVAAEQKVS